MEFSFLLLICLLTWIYSAIVAQPSNYNTRIVHSHQTLLHISSFCANRTEKSREALREKRKGNKMHQPTDSKMMIFWLRGSLLQSSGSVSSIYQPQSHMPPKTTCYHLLWSPRISEPEYNPLSLLWPPGQESELPTHYTRGTNSLEAFPLFLEKALYHHAAER